MSAAVEWNPNGVVIGDVVVVDVMASLCGRSEAELAAVRSVLTEIGPVEI
jgi:hypothetical protein